MQLAVFNAQTNYAIAVEIYNAFPQTYVWVDVENSGTCSAAYTDDNGFGDNIVPCSTQLYSVCQDTVTTTSTPSKKAKISVKSSFSLVILRISISDKCAQKTSLTNTNNFVEKCPVNGSYSSSMLQSII
jgi:hypothetical protein